MKKGTYSTQRLVCDHLRSVGGVDNIVVTKALLKSTSSARQRYLYHLEEQKKRKQQKHYTQKGRHFLMKLMN